MLRVLIVCVAAGAASLLVVVSVMPETRVAPVDPVRSNAGLGMTVVISILAYLATRWLNQDVMSFAFLTVLVIIGATSEVPTEVVDGRGLIIFALPIMAAGLLLPPWSSFIFAAMSSAAIVWVGSSVPGHDVNVPIILVFFFLALIAWASADTLQRSSRRLYQALAELRRREADFRVMFANNPLPMCLARVSDARLVEVNDAAVAQYGYARDEFLSLRVRDILAELPAGVDPAAPMPRQWPYYGEQRHRRRDGTIRDMIVHAELVSISGGDAVLVTAQDITERKQVEQRLRLMLRTVEESPVATVITGSGEAIEFVNREFEEMSGFQASEVLGKRWRDLYPVVGEKQTTDEISVALAEGRAWRGEFDAVHREGGRARISLSLAMLRDAAGSVTHSIGLAQDVTARRVAEEALHTLNAELEQRVSLRTVALEAANRKLEVAVRVKDAFLATMSHELRTPLTGVLGGADMLLEGIHGTLNPAQRRLLSRIRDSGRHLLAMISDILDLSSLEAGKLALDYSRVVLQDVCIAARSTVDAQVREMQHTLTCTCAAGDLMIEADPVRLKQMIRKLLENAIKFTPAGGAIRLEITAEAAEGMIRFAVFDTGIGIAPDKLETIFQPFFQVDGGLNRVYGGSGLGLPLVSRLAELHGGSVGVESTLGQGSCFWVDLPWQPTSDVAAAPAVLTVAGRRPLVLLAEDSLAGIDTMTSWLRMAGCDVVIVDRSDAIVGAAAKRRPDLILMHAQLLPLNASETIRLIRTHADASLAATPLLVFGGVALPDARTRHLAAGANEYLCRPFTPQTLVAAMQRILTAAST